MQYLGTVWNRLDVTPYTMPPRHRDAAERPEAPLASAARTPVVQPARRWLRRLT